MALRLRRGTDVERLLITPLEGELVYTTDTKKVYIGDGSTTGGIPIDSDTITNTLSDLTDVDTSGVQDGDILVYNSSAGEFQNSTLALSVNDLTDVDTAGVALNDILKWNGSAFVPSSNNVTIVSGTYEIDVIGDLTGSVFADDSSLVIDGTDGSIYGNLTGSLLSSNSNIIVDSDLEAVSANGGLFGNLTGNVFGSVFSENGTILLNSTTNSVNAPGGISGDLSGDVFGSVFSVDSSIMIDNVNKQIFGDLTGSVFADDSSIMIDSSAKTINAAGGISGDVFGSVISDDGSTVLVDSFNNSVNAPGGISGDLTGDVFGSLTGSVIAGANTAVIEEDGFINAEYGVGTVTISSLTNTSIKIQNLDYVPGTKAILSIEADDERSELAFVRRSESDLTGQELQYGSIIFERNDSTGRHLACQVVGLKQALVFFHNDDGNLVESNAMDFRNGKLSVGGYVPTETLDIRGNGKFAGTVTAASFNGSVVSDDSTTIIDAIDGTVSAQGFIQFGSYTDAEISNITPQNGMVYYNSTANRFRGYQNNAWINLDDGTSA